VILSDKVKKHLKIDEKTHARLLGCGKKGDTFDKVINRVIDRAKLLEEYRAFMVNLAETKLEDKVALQELVNRARQRLELEKKQKEGKQ
jgi:hypothetical protein